MPGLCLKRWIAGDISLPAFLVLYEEVRRTSLVVCGGLGSHVFSLQHFFLRRSPTSHHSVQGWLPTQLLKREIPVRAC